MQIIAYKKIWAMKIILRHKFISKFSYLLPFVLECKNTNQWK